MIPTPRLWLRCSFSLWSGLVAALAAGCSKPQIAVYEAPKEAVASATPGAGVSANDQFAPVARAPLTWKKPVGWTELPADQMRAAAFSIEGANGLKADITVIPLPALGETDLQNVNRWRTQLGLPPVAPADLAPVLGVVSIDGQAAKFFDIGQTPAPPAAKRILIAEQRRGEVEWYVKMTGDDALVQAQRAAFLQFTQSLEFGGADAALPQGWRSVEPGPMQKMKFATAAQAEVTLSTFPGDVGGVLANVNRWRKQIQLPPLAEAELPAQTQPLPNIVGGVLADFTSADHTQRVVAIIVPRAGETAFYKLTGTPAAVESERARFVHFAEDSK